MPVRPPPLPAGLPVLGWLLLDAPEENPSSGSFRLKDSSPPLMPSASEKERKGNERRGGDEKNVSRDQLGKKRSSLRERKREREQGKEQNREERKKIEVSKSVREGGRAECKIFPVENKKGKVFRKEGTKEQDKLFWSEEKYEGRKKGRKKSKVIRKEVIKKRREE